MGQESKAKTSGTDSYNKGLKKRETTPNLMPVEREVSRTVSPSPKKGGGGGEPSITFANQGRKKNYPKGGNGKIEPVQE